LENTYWQIHKDHPVGLDLDSDAGINKKNEVLRPPFCTPFTTPPAHLSFLHPVTKHHLPTPISIKLLKISVPRFCGPSSNTWPESESEEEKEPRWLILLQGLDLKKGN
jgi:hypothetical protein